MSKKGFTLVELMVTVTIMMIMTLVVFFNYNKFNDGSLLNSLAYDMSLTIRQAQVYGTGVREIGVNSQPITINTVISTSFSDSYGVHFDLANPTSFIMFHDAPTVPLASGRNIGDGVYRFADDGEPLQTYTFQRGIKIKELCFSPSQGAADSCLSGTGGEAGKLDITFLRPDPEAVIRPIDSGGNLIGGNIGSASIYLQNSDGSITRSVVISAVGQISVQ